MKVISIAAKWLFILCLPVLLLTASVGVAVNSHWLYEKGFEKYDISQTTSIAEAELGKAANGLISYFNSGEDDISLTVTKDGEPFELFNQREVAHLRDVKGLITGDADLCPELYRGQPLLAKEKIPAAAGVGGSDWKWYHFSSDTGSGTGHTAEL